MKVRKEHSFSFEKRKSVLVNIKELKVVNKVMGINQKKN
jgi:hypothetical protein